MKRPITLLLLVITLLIASQAPRVSAASIAQDGFGRSPQRAGGFISNPGYCTFNSLLTTTNSPDVILLALTINDTVTSVSSPTDTAGLSFTMRASTSAFSNVQIFYFYAIASTTLTNENVTFHLSSAAVGTACFAVGISGANTKDPFDPNVALPYTNSTSGTMIAITYTTSYANDFLVMFYGECASGGGGQPQQGFALFASGGLTPNGQTSNCPSNYLQLQGAYETVSSIQVSKTISWNFRESTSQIAIVGDAIQSASTLSASVTAGSNAVDVGQLVSFSCSGAGGVPPYTYSWAFGDGSTGSQASTIHRYTTSGMTHVVCTVTDSLGIIASEAIQLTVSPAPSIKSFVASPASVDAGEKVTFTVTTSGGYGSLSYSYAYLPTGCQSANKTTLSCTPTSSGTYSVAVTVTDRAMESARATTIITVGPQKVLGLPRETGLAVIFGAIVGASAVSIMSVALALRQKKRRRSPSTG